MVASKIVAAVLSLSAAAIASPIQGRGCSPRSNHPPTSSAKAVTLYVSVKEPSADVSPYAQGYTLTPYHSGAGSNFAVLLPQDADPRNNVFFHNGTDAQVASGAANLVNDRNGLPFRLQVQPSNETVSSLYPDEHVASVDVIGGRGPGVTFNKKPFLTVENSEGPGGSFLACRNELPYYQNQTFTVLAYQYEGEDTPDGCAQVNLLPQCAELTPLPDEPLDSYDFVHKVPCYKDVSSIDWSKYTS